MPIYLGPSEGPSWGDAAGEDKDTDEGSRRKKDAKSPRVKIQESKDIDRQKDETEEEKRARELDQGAQSLMDVYEKALSCDVKNVVFACGQFSYPYVVR